MTGGYSGLFFTEMKEHASRRLHQIAAHMPPRDWCVAIKFCGEQWSAPESLRAAWRQLREAGLKRLVMSDGARGLRFNSAGNIRMKI